MTKPATPTPPIEALRAEVRALRGALAQSHGQVAQLIETVAALTARLAPIADDNPSLPRASAAGFPIVPRDWPLRFGRIAPIDQFLTTGWWPPEEWGVWSKEASQLSFALPPECHGQAVTLALSLRAFVPPGAESPSVDFVVNGYFMGSHVLRRPYQRLRLRLPASCTASGDLVLQIAYDNPTSAAEAGIGIDERSLGVGLVMLEIL
jgi:hypothetical protein